jgi:hypothetical protein
VSPPKVEVKHDLDGIPLADPDVDGLPFEEPAVIKRARDDFDGAPIQDDLDGAPCEYI